MTVGTDSLQNYYVTNFGLMQHHKYSLTELDNMIPWEKQIYVGLLLQYIEKEKMRLEEESRKKH